MFTAITVFTAMSGTEAIALFENWGGLVEVHLLLVDLKMPDMNGTEAVKRIHELRPGLPALYFSGYSEDETLRPVFARGIPFLAKPFMSLQLIRKIRQTVDDREAESVSPK